MKQFFHFTNRIVTNFTKANYRIQATLLVLFVATLLYTVLNLGHDILTFKLKVSNFLLFIIVVTIILFVCYLLSDRQSDNAFRKPPNSF